MKKTRIIAAALMAAVISAGAGYAAWTDTLNINSTASTGTMNVEFTGNPVFPTAVALERLLPTRADYTEPGIDWDADTVTVTLAKLYPGAGMLYTAQFENKGSIPVKIQDVKVEIPNTEFANKMKANLDIIGGYIHTNNSGTELKNYGVFLDPYIPILNPNPNNKLSAFEQKLAQLKDKVLQPGDKISLDIPEENKAEIAAFLESEGIEGYNPAEQNCIIMGLPKSAGQDLMSENANDPAKTQSFTFNIKFNFKQFNK